MGNLTRYYQVIFLLFLFSCIFNLQFASKFSEDKCYTMEVITSGTTPQTVQVETSITLTTFPLLIGIFYAINAGLCLLTFLEACYFDDKVSKEYSNFGIFWKCFGACLRVFPLIMTLLHLIVLIFILVQFYFIFGNDDCDTAIHVEDTKLIEGKMHDESIPVNFVTLGIWIIIHIIGPQIRRCIFIEPFIYSPVDDGRYKILDWCFFKVGL